MVTSAYFLYIIVHYTSTSYGMLIVPCVRVPHLSLPACQLLLYLMLQYLPIAGSHYHSQ